MGGKPAMSKVAASVKVRIGRRAGGKRGKHRQAKCEAGRVRKRKIRWNIGQCVSLR
ncbi:hypothetical protein AA21952_0626 [Acetobacter oeni LMG 21952]|nr:hypothetical protein AA21952_0626 [Acetobacter oeni LMG 21952]